jgi:hypothetical protein
MATKPQPHPSGARRVPLLLGGLAAIGYLWLQWLGRTSGSTRAERAAALPGDDVVTRPHFVTDHAITVDAPPRAIWPWLAQMGWHRGGWYTARWVDRLLFPANEAAVDHIHPEWQGLAVGDQVPDGAPETECFFVVHELEPDHYLVLHSTSHLPPGFRDRVGATIDFTWVFSLTDLGGRTRFHFRSRARLGPRWLSVAYLIALVPADHIMGQQMLRGVKTRAERPGSSPEIMGSIEPEVVEAIIEPRLPEPPAEIRAPRR